MPDAAVSPQKEARELLSKPLTLTQSPTRQGNSQANSPGNPMEPLMHKQASYPQSSPNVKGSWRGRSPRKLSSPMGNDAALPDLRGPGSPSSPASLSQVGQSPKLSVWSPVFDGISNSSRKKVSKF